MTSRRHPAHRMAASQPGQIASPAAAIAAARGAELAVENRELRRENEQLVRELASRSVIDQAMGIIMGTQHCTADQAFTILRGVSQTRNVRLAQIAQELVISRETVRNHVRALLRAMKVHSRLEAVAEGRLRGLIP